MRRRRIWKIITVVLLTLLLAFLGVWFLNYRATKDLAINFVQTTSDAIAAPTYLYMFDGTGAKIASGSPEATASADAEVSTGFKRPVGVLVVGETVYVADSEAGVVYRFDSAGKPLGAFGKGRLITPLYLAVNPKNGNIYVSDRATHAIQIFSKDGKWVSVFNPNLPKDQVPAVPTKGVTWMPIALGFGPDGSLYVTELFKGHRIVKFGPDGKFVASVGIQGQVNKPQESPEFFSFPNSIKVINNEVWVVDSNNRRVKVFTPNLVFKRTIDTKGLPRGMGFLARSEEGTSTQKFAVVDTLAHSGSIWNAKGERLADFGQRGILEGQFNYPTDISVGQKNLLFITDSVNARVQVWGWPSQVSPIPTVTLPPYWMACLAPLFLLPFLLFFARKRRFLATADFVETMISIDMADLMPSRRRKWLASAEDYERIKDMSQGDLVMGELFEPSDYSESDARALAERLELDDATSIVLSIAQRAKVFCTNDSDLRRYAKVLDVDVVNHEEFLTRFAGGKADSRRAESGAQGLDDEK